MIKLTIAVGIFFAAFQPAFAGEGIFIKKIIEAGLVGCDDDAPESLGPNTYKNTIKICSGKESCSLAPVKAAQYGCTSMFVQFKCSDGSNHEVSNKRIGQKFTLKCE